MVWDVLVWEVNDAVPHLPTIWQFHGLILGPCLLFSSSSLSYFLFILSQQHASFLLVFSHLWPLIQCLGPRWKHAIFTVLWIGFVLMPIRIRLSTLVPIWTRSYTQALHMLENLNFLFTLIRSSASRFYLSRQHHRCHNLNILDTLYWIFLGKKHSLALHLVEIIRIRICIQGLPIWSGKMIRIRPNPDPQHRIFNDRSKYVIWKHKVKVFVGPICVWQIYFFFVALYPKLFLEIFSEIC